MIGHEICTCFFPAWNLKHALLLFSWHIQTTCQVRCNKRAPVWNMLLQSCEERAFDPVLGVFGKLDALWLESPRTWIVGTCRNISCFYGPFPSTPCLITRGYVTTSENCPTVHSSGWTWGWAPQVEMSLPKNINLAPQWVGYIGDNWYLDDPCVYRMIQQLLHIKIL